MTAWPISVASTAGPAFLAEQPSSGGLGFWLFSFFLMALWLMGLALMPRLWRAGAALHDQVDDSLATLGQGGSSLALREFVPAFGVVFGVWLFMVGEGLSDNPGEWNSEIGQLFSGTGFTLTVLSAVLAVTIALFNRPRFLVMPHLRAHRGGVVETIARLRRLTGPESRRRHHEA